MNKRTEKADQFLVGFVWLCAMLLPHQGILYLFNPAILLYLAARYSRRQNVFRVQYALAVILVLSFLFAALFAYATPKSILRALIISEILVFFPFVKNIRIKNVFIYAALVFILVSQVMYVLNIRPVISLYNSVYPYSGEDVSYQAEYLSEHSQNILTMGQGLNERFGGLFHNSNACMKYVCLILLVFLIENKKKNFSSKLPFYGMTLFSSLLAGSRTGFYVVICLILFNAIYSISKRKKISGVIFVLLILFLFGVMYLPLGQLRDKYRVFDFGGDTIIAESLAIKWRNFDYYLKNVGSLVPLVIGNFEIELFQSRYGSPWSMFDSEWGNIIFMYGIVFFLLLLFFFLKVFRRTSYAFRLSFVLLLWAVSSTVLFSYRTSFAFMLILSKYTYPKAKGGSIASSATIPE